MRELFRRIAYLLNRRRLERELSEEMAVHREQMPPERRGSFGNELRLREDSREAWGFGWLDRLHQDLTYGARVLRNSPGFTFTAMLVLALGVGVPLSAFRLMMADLKDGAAPDPDSLVQLSRRAPGVFITRLPFPQVAFYQANAKSFRAVIGVLDRNAGIFGDAEPVHLAFVTANYFPEFGVVPVAGRVLTSEDERSDAEPPAIVGEVFWRNRLGADPAVIGQDIRVNGKRLRVVGVAPQSAKIRDDVWLPLARHSYVVEGSTLLTDWNSSIESYARLAGGVSPQAAEQESLALAARLREVQPDRVHKGEYLDARPILRFDVNSREYQVVLSAGAMVLLLLVAACANLGTLVLARGVTREREIRTRMALGAGRGRVVRQLFTESLLLSALSCLCALAISTVVLKAIQMQHNPGASALPDWQSLLATSFAALLAAFTFGLPPAFRLTSPKPEAGRSRKIFLATQVAVSCLLLLVSSILASSLRRLITTDPGFDYRHLAAIAPGLKSHGYAGPAAQDYLASLRSRTSTLPGVRSVSEARLMPWGNMHIGSAWLGRQYGGNHVDPQFLETMGMRLTRGRNFRPGEKNVSILSEAAARTLWPDQDPIGKAIPWQADGPTVIGTVSDASTTAVADSGLLEYYEPISTSEAADSVLLLRVDGRPEDFVSVLRDAARTLDRRLQPAVQTMADLHGREVEKFTRLLAVISVLSLVSVLLSTIGLAGLASYTVAQRTREFGIRLALGANPAQIVRAILEPMRAPVIAGFAIGSAGASALALILRSSEGPGMSGLKALDPLAYLLAIALFTAVVAMAIFAPGRRAISIDPSKALQQD